MKFSEITGQNKVKELLKRSFDEGHVSHAQLLAGKSGYGTLALALAYAQYVLCENHQNGDSCGVCPSCYKVAHLEHPDLHFSFPVAKSDSMVNRNSNGTEVISDSLIEMWRSMIEESSPLCCFSEKDWYEHIGIGKNSQGIINRSEAHEIIRKFSYKSYEGGYKILIMWLPERMNDSAANKLLKLFEEPAEKTLFLFVSENPDSVLKTILSRTQTLYVPPVEREYVANYLTDRFGDDIDAERVARMSQGDLIRAVDIVTESEKQQDEDDENFTMFTSLMRLCFAVNHVGLMEWGESMAALSREAQKDFVDYSLKMLRDSYMVTVGMPELNYSYGKEAQFITRFFPFVNHANIEILISEFERVALELTFNANTKILFTHFALSISKLIRKA